jgi:hypothetical protein
MDGDVDDDGLLLALGLPLADGEAEADGDPDAEGDIELDGEALADGLTDADCDTEALGDTDALGLPLADGEAEADGLFDADGLPLADGETDADGDTDADPAADSVSATNHVAVWPATARVGLLVSPVLVLIRNSPLTYSALAFARDWVLVIAVKLVVTVICVVVRACLARPRRYRRLLLVSDEKEDEPNPLTDPCTTPVPAASLTRILPAPTVNFQKVQHLSVMALPKLTVMFVAVPTAPLATKRHTDTVTPSAPAPVDSVYSPSLVHVPVPPVTLVWSADTPFAVLMLSAETIRIPWSPDARVLVAVAKVNADELVPFAPVPRVPTEAMAIG